MFRKLITLFIIFVIVVTALWWFALQLQEKHDTQWNTWFIIAYAFVYIVCGFYSIGSAFSCGGFKNALGKSLFFNGIGIIAWGLSFIILSYYLVVVNQAAPYPSLIDVFAVLFAPLLLFGMWHTLKTTASAFTLGRIIETIVLFALIGFIVFQIILEPHLSPDIPLSFKLLNILYPLGTTLLIATSLASLRIGGDAALSLLFPFVLGFLFHATGDFLMVYHAMRGIQWNGDISYIAYLVGIGMIFFGLMRIAKPIDVPKI
ncbi:MAG: hypothetical protein HYW78_02645 [Parcubacteria group bacterium]|nr:hypothetical protein [Parcubacteria group bacterium]